jgi:hypothetical protein
MRSDEELSAAAEACLASAMGADDPFRAVTDFLLELQTAGGWTDGEIVAVQSRVIQALMSRLNPPHPSWFDENPPEAEPGATNP